MGSSLFEVVVSAADDAAEAIRRLELRPSAGGDLPAFTAGAHVDVATEGGVLRQYSLANDPAERGRYVIAVQREDRGRGGSRWLHDAVRIGDRLRIGSPRNNFPLDEAAGRHLLIGGGIGITPLMAMIHRLRAIGAHWRLVYCTRNPARTAFARELGDPALAERVLIHHDQGLPERAFDFAPMLRAARPHSHLYCCGPAPLMAAVRAAAVDWPSERLHFEAFAAEPAAVPGGDGAFTLRIASSGRELLVPAGKSALSVLEEAGFDIPFSCEEGICGSCVTGVLEGAIDHRDFVLSEREQRDGRMMMLCVSRGLPGATVTLDL